MGYSKEGFKEVLTDYSFYIGFDRYNWFSSEWGFIAVIDPLSRTGIREYTENLDSGDVDAHDASVQLKKFDNSECIYIGLGNTPSIAMNEAETIAKVCLDDELEECENVQQKDK